MPRREIKLSWFEPTRQWRKYRKCKLTGKGKMHYLEPKGVKKSDRNAKALAWENWLAKLSEIEYEERHPSRPKLVARLVLGWIYGGGRSQDRRRENGISIQSPHEFVFSE